MKDFMDAAADMSLMGQLVLLDALTKDIQEKVDPATFALIEKAIALSEMIGEA